MSNKTVKNVGIILGCSIVAKILSYIMEAILAAYLGATDEADAFYLTSNIFGIIFPILDLGIWKVFLPIYKTKLVTGDEHKTSHIANTAITLFCLLSIALVLLIISLAKPIVAITGPGFDLEKRALTVKFVRISSPAYLLMALASIIGAMLQSRERFLGSQIREIGTHASKIIYVYICYKYLGIYAAVTAFIIGSIFRIIVQLPFINWNWRFKPSFSFKDTDIVTMLKGLPSVAVTAAIAHINGLVDKMIASGSGSGSVACLNYGHRLMNVFSGMISTAIGTAVYPTIIQFVAEKKEKDLRELLRNVINALVFLIVPISLFCFLFSTELVTVAFQRGKFDATASAITSQIFVGYCVGMIFTGLSSVITNVFYAYGDTKKTLYISILNIGLNILFDLLFIRFFGVAGVAYATSLSAAICFVVRLILLKKYLIIGYKAIIINAIKISVLSFVCCFIPFVILNYMISINVYLSLFVSIIFCVFAYLALSKLMHIKTLDYIIGLARKRTKRA